jgi:hypothetical protein
VSIATLINEILLIHAPKEIHHLKTGGSSPDLDEEIAQAHSMFHLIPNGYDLKPGTIL